MSSRLLLAALLVIGLPAALSAQVNRRAPQGWQSLMTQPPTDIDGAVEAVMPGRIMVLDKNNQSWQVAVPVSAKVQVTGGATADYLLQKKMKMIVEFKAEIDDQRAVKEKVEELKVVTLSPGAKMGLFPPDSKAGEDQGGFAAGSDAAGAGEKKTAKRTAATAGKGTAKAGGIAAGTYRIVGHLIVGHGGKFSVQPGRGKPLPFELSDKVAIGVEFADYMIATKGDKISGKVIKIPPRPGSPQAQPITSAMATELKIELAEPLVGAKKKGTAAKSEAKHPAKHPKKDEGLPEPAAEK
jgi:hypothetical protein